MAAQSSQPLPQAQPSSVLSTSTTETPAEPAPLVLTLLGTISGRPVSSPAVSRFLAASNDTKIRDFAAGANHIAIING
jgi:hypothetical protein